MSVNLSRQKAEPNREGGKVGVPKKIEKGVRGGGTKGGEAITHARSRSGNGKRYWFPLRDSSIFRCGGGGSVEKKRSAGQRGTRTQTFGTEARKEKRKGRPGAG